jgi:NAD(P)H-dependent flavin oxidoreductase YrpB (nitropropane dioxygenase family)
MATVTRSALHTPLCDLLGIRYPICQAGMAFVAPSGLAAAVSEAGGLGVLAAAHASPAELRNAFTREWEKREGEIQPFPLQFERVGKPAAIRAREAGDIENGSAACGQSAGLIHDVRPAAEIIVAVVDEASSVLARLSR